MRQTIEQGDWLAQQFFSQADLRMTPEEYAARHAHLWGCFSLHLHKYTDPALGFWVLRLGEILSSEEELRRCRERFLSKAEMEEVARQEAQEF